MCHYLLGRCLTLSHTCLSELCTIPHLLEDALDLFPLQKLLSLEWKMVHLGHNLFKLFVWRQHGGCWKERQLCFLCFWFDIWLTCGQNVPYWGLNVGKGSLGSNIKVWQEKGGETADALEQGPISYCFRGAAHCQQIRLVTLGSFQLWMPVWMRLREKLPQWNVPE